MTVYNIKTDFGANNAVGDGVADDSGAFAAAGNLLNGTSGHTLYIPAGTYAFLSNTALSGRFPSRWAEGITQFTCVGDGAGSTTIALGSICNRLAGLGQPRGSANYSKIATASAGASSIFLLTTSEYSRFTVGRWILVSGLNTQDIYDTPYGYPSNFQFFEYAQISAIDSGTGEISLSAPLAQTYKSTWPLVNEGNAFEAAAGGCAGIYVLPASWDTTVEYQGLTFTRPDGAQIYPDGKSAIFRDCIFPSTGSGTVIPSQNKFFGMYDCTIASAQVEVDKIITECVLDGCTIGNKIDFQSASITTLTMNNCSIDECYGSGITSTITGCTLGIFQPGPSVYGVGGDLIISNTSVTEWREGGNVTNVEQSGTMTSGVIRMPDGQDVIGITDNGAGKARFEVASSAGYFAGKFSPTGSPAQTLVLTSTTTSGTDVLNFASVPAWIVNGQAIVAGGGIPSGTTVISTTTTTITMSKNATSNVTIGSGVSFVSAALSGDAFHAKEILSVPDSTHIDFDLNFPTGFSLSYGGAIRQGAVNIWAVPDKYIHWYGSRGRSGIFKVTDVTQDADCTYIATDQAGGFPTIPTTAGVGVQIKTLGAQRIRASGLSGSSIYNEQLNYPASYDKPLFSYFKKSYTGSDSATKPDNAATVGLLSSIVIDVVTPYTGALGTLFIHLHEFATNMRWLVDGSEAFWDYGVNAKVAGRRVITLANTSTNATAQSGDGSLLVPSWSSGIWLVGSQPRVCLQQSATQSTVRNISAEASNLWPVINIEITTDQGIPASIPSAVVPLRFRLRA